jgi:hypothetical protein
MKSVGGIDFLREVMQDTDILNWLQEIYEKCPSSFRDEMSFTTIRNAIYLERFRELEMQCERNITEVKRIDRETDRMWSGNPNYTPGRSMPGEEETLVKFMGIMRRLSNHKRDLTPIQWIADA